MLMASCIAVTLTHHLFLSTSSTSHSH